MGLKRGEVWWADLEQPAGRRPVLLLSRDSAYPVRAFAIVAPLSTRVRGIPAEVGLGPGDGVPRPCAANLDVLWTVELRSLSQRITVLSRERLAEVDRALRFALGLRDRP